MSSNSHDLQDREGLAALVGVVLLFGVPALMFAVMLYLSAMLDVFGDSNVHQQVWGWLSHKEMFRGYVDSKGVKQHGYTEWHPNSVPLKYAMLIVTTYIAYQVCEGLNLGARAFARFLVKQWP